MINEKQLIEILQKNSIFEKITNAEGKNIYEIIDDLPKVDEWIPCSDRLPEEEEAYSYNEEEDTYEPNEFIVMIEGAELPTVAFFDGEDFTGGYNNEFFNKVIAWMPLPEPYNADMRKKVE